MSDQQNFVVDSNIIVSALLNKEGKARQVLDKAQDFGRILMSESLLVELEQVLNRSKFDKYITKLERQLFLVNFAKTVKFVDVRESVEVCRDPKDHKILELALSGDAAYIVSGDADLLILNPFQAIAILTIQEFLDIDIDR